MQKVRDHCYYTGKYRGAAHSNCNLKYRTEKKIPVVFNNGSTYDYNFIINKLATEFKYYSESLGKNTEKYIIFSVSIKKVLDKDKKDDNDSDNDKNKKKDKGKKAKLIRYGLSFIDSCRLMPYSLLNLVDNLSGINKVSEFDKKISPTALIEKFF